MIVEYIDDNGDIYKICTDQNKKSIEIRHYYSARPTRTIWIYRNYLNDVVNWLDSDIEDEWMMSSGAKQFIDVLVKLEAFA